MWAVVPFLTSNIAYPAAGRKKFLNFLSRVSHYKNSLKIAIQYLNKEYLKKIFKILSSVQDIWILEQVYRCVVNITREDKN